MKDEAVRRDGIAASDAYAALQTKLEELDAYTHNVLHQFPRLERHLLCSDMRGATNRMQRLPATARAQAKSGGPVRYGRGDRGVSRAGAKGEPLGVHHARAPGCVDAAHQ